MKAESTIRKALSMLNSNSKHIPRDDRANDQAYGAIEALRWVLGDGPSVVGLAEPLGLIQGDTNANTH